MRRIVLLLALLVSRAAPAQQQMADPAFDSKVERPAYTRTHPVVVIDEAHANFHTADGRYKPLADLLSSDGYKVQRGTAKLTRASLAPIQVLVIANAGAPPDPAECDAVRDWVKAGGSLLLIADHAPHGERAQPLADRFGITMGKGYVFDPAHADRGATILVYSSENGLLGAHPIVKGHGPGTEVKRVVAFTGQSLSVPAGAVALMKLGATAREAPTPDDARAALQAKDAGPSAPVRSVAGGAQGVVMAFGKGKVAVFGEAAMFSAQVVRLTRDGKEVEIKAGMNVPGNDNRQLALNLFHWLSGLLR
jgi:hypothetical protein